MGHLNLETGLAGLIAVLVVLFVSLSFSMGIVASMGKLTPSDTSAGNGTVQNTGIAGSTGLLTTSAIVAVVFLAIVVVLAAFLLRKGNDQGA
jgi:acid phosphatase family membrane protein YuiD